MNLHTSTHLTRPVVLASIALLLGMTWTISALGKLLAGGVPEWFIKTFEPTFLKSLPGLTISFYSIALLEAVAALFTVGSLITGEFLRKGPPTLLKLGLYMSLLLFIQLGFGKQLIQDYAGAHELFMYFVGALVMLLAIRSLQAPEPVR
jgi:hypothetical protein